MLRQQTEGCIKSHSVGGWPTSASLLLGLSHPSRFSKGGYRGTLEAAPSLSLRSLEIQRAGILATPELPPAFAENAKGRATRQNRRILSNRCTCYDYAHAWL